MLSRIVAENFLSWKNLDFEVPKKITLIDGWNEDDGTSEGSGKSATVNAISWCVYGKLPKDSKIDDVIKDGETSCSVTLLFSNGDAIVRTRKPNDLFIRKFSGTVVKGKDAKETQEMIEEYVGCNFETFCQSTYFAQNYDKKFLSSNQEDKGKILSSIQNLQVFDKARKETMDLLKLETEKQSTLKNQIQIEQNNIKNFESQKGLVESFIKEKIKKHNDQVEMLTSQKNGLLRNIETVQENIRRIQEEASKINLESLSSDEAELNKVRADYSSNLSKIVYEKSQFDTTKRTILSKEVEGKTLASKYTNLQNKKQQTSNLESDPRYIKLLDKKRVISDVQKSTSYIILNGKKTQLENYLQNPTKICPSCGTELKNIDLSHTQKELEGINRELSDLMTRSAEELNDINGAILDYEQEFKKTGDILDQEMASVLTQLQVISDYLDQNKIPSVEDLEKQETSIKEVLSQIDQAMSKIQSDRLTKAKLENEVSTSSRSLDNYNQQLKTYEESLAKLKEPDVAQDYQNLQVIQTEIQNASMRLGQVEGLMVQSQTHHQRLESLKEGFKEIKSYVFTNALNELNFRTNQYLSELFEVEASIKFTNEDQKIESKIILDGRESGLGLLSGGQSRRFNLAVDLALSDIVSYRKTSKLDLLILDEYFKDLSEISMEKCLNLLKSRKCPVLLIEHNSIFKNIVDNTFFVRLENGTSNESRQ